MSTYKNGPEGMPRVERMTDSTIGSLYLSVRHIDHATEREIAFAHAAAEEVLARLPAWPTPSPGTGTTASAAGTAVQMLEGSAEDEHQQAVSDFRKAAYERDLDAIFPAQLRIFAAFKAHAEEARREAAGDMSKLCDTFAIKVPEGLTPMTAIACRLKDLQDALAAAQRTAGWDAEKVECKECNGTGSAGFGDRCSDCNGKGYDWDPVAEAAAQADDDLDATTYGYPYAMRAELAHAFLKPYMDAKEEKLLDYEVQPIIRRLAAAILEWLSLDKVPTAAPTAQPTQPDDERASPTFMDERQAQDWAWKAVRKDCDDGTWTTGESGNYFGFFLHGWRYREQYEKQRRAALRQPGALPDEARAAFETWIQDDKEPPFVLKDDKGNYCDSDVDHCWYVWQAACTALAAKQAGKEV